MIFIKNNNNNNKIKTGSGNGSGLKTKKKLLRPLLHQNALYFPVKTVVNLLIHFQV